MARSIPKSTAWLLGVMLLVGLASVQLPGQQVKLLTADTGWVLSHNTLYWTADRGESWSDITPVPPGVVRSAVTVHNVFFVNAQEGWAVIAYPEKVIPETPEPMIYPKVIYEVGRTPDNGNHWSFVRFTYPRLPEWQQEVLAGPGDMFFLDDFHGWMVMQMTGSSNFAPAKLLATNDGGESWNWVNSPGTLGTLLFTSTQRGWLAGGPGGMRLYATRDGCRTWHEVHMTPPSATVGQPTFEGPPVFRDDNHAFEAVAYRGGPSSPPTLVVYSTSDGGKTWNGIVSLGVSPGGSFPVAITDSELVVPTGSWRRRTFGIARVPLSGRLTAGVVASRTAAIAVSFVDSADGWMFTTRGRLLATKDGGASWKDVTPWPAPPKGKVVPIPSTSSATGGSSETESSSAQPLTNSGGGTGGNAHTSLHLGFDIACAPAPAQTVAWWDYSPYHDIGIYLGGANVSCKQNTYLTASWVSTVTGSAPGSTQDWGLLPLWVGPQAPCYTSSNTYSVFSTDPTTASSQGQQEAQNASGAASSLGLSGSITYYDLENYDTTNAGCVAAVESFLSGWVAEIRSLGYLAGVYTNGTPVQQDVSQVSPAPDDVWITHYDKKATIFDPLVNDSVWSNHQRIRQYWLNASESYGGVSLGIDRDIENGAVAGGNGAKSISSYTATVLDYPGAVQTWALGTNDDYMGQPGELGDIVGFYCTTSSPCPVGYLSNNGSFTSLLDNGQQTQPQGINNTGKIVGWTLTGGFEYDTVSATYTALNCPGGQSVYAQGVSDDGRVAGTYNTAQGYEGFLYSSGNCSVLTYPGASSTVPNAINGQGQVVGYYLVNGKSHGFIWSAPDGWTRLDCKGSSSTVLLGINNNGQVLAYCGGLYNQYVYDTVDSTWTPVAVPAANNGLESCVDSNNVGLGGINDSGVVVSSWEDQAYKCEGFYSTPNP